MRKAEQAGCRCVNTAASAQFAERETTRSPGDAIAEAEMRAAAPNAKTSNGERRRKKRMAETRLRA